MDIKDLFKKDTTTSSTIKKPNHMALTIDGTFVWASKNKEKIEDVFKKNYLNIKNIIKLGVNNNIPIITFYLLPEYEPNNPNFSQMMDWVSDAFEQIKEWDFIHSNQVKISVFGKWYDLPGRVVDPIKETVSETKDYDKYFVNFCINYNGQEEIVDACKIIIKQVAADKMNPDMITKDTIKENIYSSYFIPPDLIIKTGKVRKIKGFMLWDSVDSRIYFADKYWPEFSKQDFSKALDFFKG